MDAQKSHSGRAPAKQDETAAEQRIVSPHGRLFDERLGGRLLRDLADKLVEIRRHFQVVIFGKTTLTLRKKMACSLASMREASAMEDASTRTTYANEAASFLFHPIFPRRICVHSSSLEMISSRRHRLEWEHSTRLHTA